MRKIEADMIAAIRAHRSWKSGSTQVQISPKDNSAHVYLHGNLIATECSRGWMICDCGWQTTTTKSRLNALFAGLNLDGRLYQKRNVWHLSKTNGETIVEPHDMNLVQS